MTKAELSDVVRDEKSRTIELLVASIIHSGVVDGDQKKLEFLLDRLIGKIVQAYKVDGNVSLPQIILKMPSNGTEAK